MRTLHVITLILVIVGGLNWGLVGLFGFDLVAAIGGVNFGERTGFTNVIYILVALSALYQIVNLSGPPATQPVRR